MPDSHSLGSTDAEPVVRARIADVLAMIGRAAAQVEDDDRLDELGLDELSTAWLITELHVATGVDPFANGDLIADVRTVGDFITVYRNMLTRAERGESRAADGEAEPAGGTPNTPWRIGPLVELAADRYTAALLFDEDPADAAHRGDAEQRLPEDLLVEAARLLWIEAVKQKPLGFGQRARLWVDRVEAVFQEPVFRRRTTLECVFSSRVREPLCERVAVTTYASQHGRRAATLTAEIRLVPAAVARTHDALKARSAAVSSEPADE